MEKVFAGFLDGLRLVFCSAYRNDPIIGVPKHLRGSFVLAFLCGLLPAPVAGTIYLAVGCSVVVVIPLVEPMQIDVGQESRHHAPYNVAKKVLAFVYQVAIPRSHLRASYGDGFQGAPLRCKKRQEEGSFTRGSGVCDEQAISQENKEIGGADHV